MKTKNKGKNNVVILILIIVVFGMLGLGNLSGLSHSPSAGTPPQANETRPLGSPSSRDIALSCTSDSYTKFHIHSRLAIIINGKKIRIPVNIGNTSTCLHPVHTHDDTGEIHVESPTQADFTLGDFFAVWGKTSNKNQIFDYKADATHKITMTVDGRSSNDYENLILKDGQDIVIEYQGNQ